VSAVITVHPWSTLTLRLVALVLMSPMLLLVAAIWGGFSRPSLVLVLEGFQMVLLAPAWAILIACLIRREWFIAFVAAVIALSHLAFCLPAATSDSVPPWAPQSPVVTLFVSNVLYDNPSDQTVADTVASADADIIILNEATPALVEELKAAGIYERYPTQVFAEARPFGELLLTRLEATDARVDNLGGMRSPSVTVTIGEQPVRVHAVHVNAPKAHTQRHVWRRQLDAIGSTVEQRDGLPMIIAGDFNSAPWHGPFRDLLDRGLTDSHDALGKGLSRSWTPRWPVLGAFGPIMRIDHAAYTDGLAARSVRDQTMPGSDHRAFTVAIAVRQPDARP